MEIWQFLLYFHIFFWFVPLKYWFRRTVDISPAPSNDTNDTILRVSKIFSQISSHFVRRSSRIFSFSYFFSFWEDPRGSSHKLEDLLTNLRIFSQIWGSSHFCKKIFWKFFKSSHFCRGSSHFFWGSSHFSPENLRIFSLLFFSKYIILRIFSQNFEDLLIILRIFS